MHMMRAVTYLLGPHMFCRSNEQLKLTVFINCFN